MVHLVVLATLLHAPALADPDTDTAPPVPESDASPVDAPAVEEEACCELGAPGDLVAREGAEPSLALEHVMHGSRVAMEVPSIVGAMDASLVQAVVDKHLGLLALCYREGVRREPTLQGRVVARLMVGRDGGVSTASLQSSTLGDEQVEACVVGRLRAMRFRAPTGGGMGIVSQPLVFSPVE